MKKSLLLSLGALGAVAAPIAITVSCGLGNVFKNKITSGEEAERVVKQMLKELSDHGSYDNDMLYYQEYGVHNAGDNVYQDATFTVDSWKGIDFDVNKTQFWNGERVHGFADWTGTHGYIWSSTPVTLNDANKTKAQAVVLYQYEKTHGTMYAGSATRTLIWNAGAAFMNAMTDWKHLIKGIALLPLNNDADQIEDAFGDAYKK